MENNQFNPEKKQDVNNELANSSINNPIPLESQAQPVEPAPSQLSNTPTASYPQMLRPEDNVSVSNQPNVIVESQSTPAGTTKQPFQFSPPGQAASSIVDSESKQKKKRFLKIIIIALVFLLILGGGGGYAYYTIMNNKPEKVLADAISNSIKDVLDHNPSSMIGSVKYEFKGEKKGSMNIEFNSKISGGDSQQEASFNMKSDEIDFTIKGAVITLGTNEVYVKFDDLRNLVEKSAKSNPDLATYAESFKPIIDKIDSKWIKIDKQSLVEFGFVESEEEVDKCSKALTDLRVSKDDKKKLKKIFLDNQFMIATEKLPKEKIENEASYHYKLDFNEEKSIKFTKSITDLESFKGVKTDCKLKNEDYDKQLEELKNNAGREADKIKPIVELWVGTKTRLPTKIKIITDEETLTMEFNSKIKINDKSFKIEAPADSMNIKDLKTEIESLFVDSSNNPLGTPSSAKDTQAMSDVRLYKSLVAGHTFNNNGFLPQDAKAVNDIINQTFNNPESGNLSNDLRIVVDTTPNEGEVQYKIKVSCSNGEFVANEQSHLFAMRAKLSDGSFFCQDYSF